MMQIICVEKIHNKYPNCEGTPRKYLIIGIGQNKLASDQNRQKKWWIGFILQFAILMSIAVSGDA